MQCQNSEMEYLCPSFSYYASETSAQIAARVANEDTGDSSEIYAGDSSEIMAGNEDDFEFDVVICSTDDRLALVDVDVNLIGTIFSSSNQKLPPVDCEKADLEILGVSSIRNTLNDLFIEDRDPPSSSSSDSEDNALRSCQSSCTRCKKSNSTGSSWSRRWNFLNIIRRSNSDGKNSVLFLNPRPNSTERDDKIEEDTGKHRRISGSKNAKEDRRIGGKRVPSAHEIFYAKNRSQEMEKRRSYLPYKQNLLGIFSGLSKYHRPS